MTPVAVTLKQPARRIVTAPISRKHCLLPAPGPPCRTLTAATTRTQRESRGCSHIEAVIALKPDLIIAWYSGNAPANVESCADSASRYMSRSRIASRTWPGKSNASAGWPGRGRLDAAAESFRTRLDGLRREYEKKARVRTFYQIWKQPLSTVGGRQIISSVIRLCGGENVFGDLQALAPVVSMKAVVAADPEVIVASGMGEARPEWLDDWKRWQAIAAVARNNLFLRAPPS